MATITAIKPTQRDPNRATIRVDRKVVATLPMTLIEAMNLKAGDAWDAAIADDVTRAAKHDKAYRQAINRLNRRSHTAREMTRKLKKLEHDEATIEYVIAKLTDLGLINDRQLGEAGLREMQRQKPAGPKLMRAKLFQKGVDRAMIDELVENATDAESQREGAMSFAEKKLRSLQRFDVATKRRRLYGALARRGFNADVINDVMEQLRDELTDNTE